MDAPSGSQLLAATAAATHTHRHTHSHSLAADTQHLPASRRRDARGQVNTQWHTRSWRHTGTLIHGHTPAGIHTDVHCHKLIVYNDTPSHTHWYTFMNTFLLTVMLSYTCHTLTHISSTTPSCWHTHGGLHRYTQTLSLALTVTNTLGYTLTHSCWHLSPQHLVCETHQH